MNSQNIRSLLDQAELDSDTTPIEHNVDQEPPSVAFGDWLYQQGVAKMDDDDYASAEDYFKRSINIYSQCYDDDTEIPCEILSPLITLGDCYSSNCQDKEALTAYKRALDITLEFRKIDRDNFFWRPELDIYIRWGQLYADAGNEEMALYYHEKSVEHLQKK